jgi:hypothetical protein
MKQIFISSLLLLMLVFKTNGFSKNLPLEWVILKVNSTIFNHRVFYKKNLSPIILTKQEGIDALELLKADFKNIKKELKLDNTITINDYRFQLVGGVNKAGDKIVSIRGIGKKLPQWIQNDFKKILIELKCTNDDVINMNINLMTKRYSDAIKDDCYNR